MCVCLCNSITYIILTVMSNYLFSVAVEQNSDVNEDEKSIRGYTFAGKISCFISTYSVISVVSSSITFHFHQLLIFC